MEVPVINRIRDFEVGMINSINDPSFLSRSVAVSGIGKLHQAYGFWKWGALIIAFLAYFTNFITRVQSFVVVRLRKLDVSASLLPSPPTLFDDYDSDSDVSCSSTVSSDNEDEDEDDESIFCGRRKRFDFYNCDDQGQNSNFNWMRPDLSAIGSSGVVKLWDDHRNVVASSLRKCNPLPCSSSPVFFAAEKTGINAVKVEACDPRVGFRMPALLAEWRQPGRLLGNIIGVDFGGVEKIYVRDDVSGEIAVGDLRRFNGALTDLTESDAETWWDADVVITADGSVDDNA